MLDIFSMASEMRQMFGNNIDCDISLNKYGINIKLYTTKQNKILCESIVLDFSIANEKSISNVSKIKFTDALLRLKNVSDLMDTE